MGSAKFLLFVALAGSQLPATVSVQLSAPRSTIQVGETLVITASAKDSSTAKTRFSFQFTVRPHNQGAFVTMQDFYFENTFPWTPSDHEGEYDIGVTAWSEATQGTAETYYTVNVESRVMDGKPVISNTNNALVALYSAPPCAAPARVQVKFKSESSPTTSTPYKNCDGLSLNFYLGGMLAQTTYSVQQLLSSGTGVVAGPELSYTTGSIPSDIVIPRHSRLSGPNAPTSTSYPYLLHATTGASAYATDLNENVVWYKTGASYHSGYLTHLVEGGTFLTIEDDIADSQAICGNFSFKSCGDHQYLREYDMAGNVIRQTSWSILNDRVNVLRAKQGRPLVRLTFLSHEGIRLPNGYTATLATNEQVKQLTSGTQDVFGDTLVVLDTHFQVVWAWDAFDYLNINRATIHATCVLGVQGCPQLYLQKQPNGQPYKQALDWTHANAITYDPQDGNLIVSVRHQSWAIKVDYNNGAGDGHIVWELGYGGSFTLPGRYAVTDWFSGQHDVEVQSNGLITLFDNNNASAVTQQPGGTAHGQAWRLDTADMVATPVVNIDLGVVSPAVGSATLLSNGNYEWEAGFVNNREARTFEYTPSGVLVYEQQSDAITYRSFRLQDLYTP